MDCPHRWVQVCNDISAGEGLDTDATTVVVAMMPKKFRDDVQRRFLGVSEEDPNIS